VADKHSREEKDSYLFVLEKVQCGFLELRCMRTKSVVLSVEVPSFRFQKVTAVADKHSREEKGSYLFVLEKIQRGFLGLQCMRTKIALASVEVPPSWEFVVAHQATCTTETGLNGIRFEMKHQNVAIREACLVEAGLNGIRFGKGYW
jgi:hypothetical protein